MEDEAPTEALLTTMKVFMKEDDFVLENNADIGPYRFLQMMMIAEKYQPAEEMMSMVITECHMTAKALYADPVCKQQFMTFATHFYLYITPRIMRPTSMVSCLD